MKPNRPKLASLVQKVWFLILIPVCIVTDGDYFFQLSLGRLCLVYRFISKLWQLRQGVNSLAQVLEHLIFTRLACVWNSPSTGILCPRHSKNGGRADSVAPVCLSICLCMRLKLKHQHIFIRQGHPCPVDAFLIFISIYVFQVVRLGLGQEQSLFCWKCLRFHKW